MSGIDYEGWQAGFDTAHARKVAEQMVDEGPFGNLLLIADTYEDEGQPEIAEGYRWLVQHKRTPRQFGESDKPYWTFTTDASTMKVWSYLPTETVEFIKALRPDLSMGPALFNYFSTVSIAYRAAAIAMGTMLGMSRLVETVEDKHLMTPTELRWSTIPDNLKDFYPSMKCEVPFSEDLRARAIKERKRSERQKTNRDIDKREQKRNEAIEKELQQMMRRVREDGEPGIAPYPPYSNPCSEIVLPMMTKAPLQFETQFSRDIIARQITDAPIQLNPRFLIKPDLPDVNTAQ